MTNQEFILKWISDHDKTLEPNTEISLLGFVGNESYSWGCDTCGTSPLTAEFRYRIIAQPHEELRYWMDEAEVIEFLNALWQTT